MKNQICQEVEKKIPSIDYMREHGKYKKIILQNKIMDGIYLNFTPRQRIKKITKTLYQKIKYNSQNQKLYSEEVFEMASNDKVPGTMRSKRSLRHIFSELRYMINTNFEGANNELFITLTYAENMQDFTRLCGDFDRFTKKLTRTIVKDRELAYISIVEPQDRGAWHVHLLLKAVDGENLFIPYDVIEKAWGHGATTTERLDCDNIGSYFIAYLSNAEIDEDTQKRLELNEDDIKHVGDKKYIKGERLKWYPEYMQIWRHSRNCVRAEKRETTYEATVPEFDEYKKKIYDSVKIIPGSEDFDLIVAKEQRRKLSDEVSEPVPEADKTCEPICESADETSAAIVDPLAVDHPSGAEFNNKIARGTRGYLGGRQKNPKTKTPKRRPPPQSAGTTKKQERPAGGGSEENKTNQHNARTRPTEA